MNNEEFLVYGVCSKCNGYKSWDTWYHSDETLCDDCYYVSGDYYNLTKEEAIRNEFKKNNNSEYLDYLKEELEFWNNLLLNKELNNQQKLYVNNLIKDINSIITVKWKYEFNNYFIK